MLRTVLVVGVLGLAGVAWADNWPQWRGPNNDGICLEKNVPTKWSKTENVLWRVPLPGPSGATPAIWGDQIFVTSAKGESDLVLLCFGTDGKQQWEASLGGGNRTSRGDEGNLAAPSPSTDGQHVLAFAGNGILGCFDLSGHEVWKFNVQDRYGKFNIQFGMTSTPVLHGDRVYLQLIHGDGKAETEEATVVALEKTTGKEVWKQKRPSEAYAENEHSYASPVIYKDGDRSFLLTHGADYVIAHDLDDGREIWRSGGLNPKDRYNPTLRLVASPVAVPGLIVVPSAKNGPVLAIRPDAKGNITENKEFRIWTRAQNTPDVPSPLVHDGLVYLCRENGNLLLLDARTGEEIFEKATTRDRHRASPVYADGHVYLTARNGATTVVKAGRDFEVVSVNKLDESTAASPAFSNGRVYMRTYDALYAIGPK